MGTSEKNLTWIWPLISIEWIPEILGSFNTIIESTWIGLQRAMTTNVPHESFGNRIFSQLKSFLIQTRLVENRGRYIASCVNPTYYAVRKHLFNCYKESSQPWSNFYRLISEMKIELHFESLQLYPPKEWPEISAYSIFKQWSEFFQYVGLGFFLDRDHFIPETAITDDMFRSQHFVERCLKSIGDPRYLTGSYSLHTEADFLTWTEGEDHLPISDDPDLFPRIPHDEILGYLNLNSTEHGAWKLALMAGERTWQKSIKHCLSIYSLPDLKKVIYTCKHLLDFFVSGSSIDNTDFIDKECVYRVRRKWESVKHFFISEEIWRLLPNLFRDLTRLYWGISYYRNSLRRPCPISALYDDSIFSLDTIKYAMRIPIRTRRTRRSLISIFKSLQLVHKSLSRLNDRGVGLDYQRKLDELVISMIGYLPSEQLELTELVRELEKLIQLHPEEKQRLLNSRRIDLNCGFSDTPIIQLCILVHHYQSLIDNPYVNAVRAIQARLNNFEKQLITEMSIFKSGISNWTSACDRLKRTISKSKPLLEK